MADIDIAIDDSYDDDDDIDIAIDDSYDDDDDDERRRRTPVACPKELPSCHEKSSYPISDIFTTDFHRKVVGAAKLQFYCFHENSIREGIKITKHENVSAKLFVELPRTDKRA